MDTETICLDTSILIDYYRKKNKSKTKFVKLSDKFNFSISVIVKFEIQVGIKPNQQSFWNEVFQKVNILPLKERDIEIASQIMKRLKSQNKIIGLKDILIGATAVSHELRLSTLNRKDFERIENLKLLP